MTCIASFRNLVGGSLCFNESKYIHYGIPSIVLGTLNVYSANHNDPPTFLLVLRKLNNTFTFEREITLPKHYYLSEICSCKYGLHFFYNMVTLTTRGST